MFNLLLTGIVESLNGFFGPTLYLILLNGFGVLAIGCKVCEYQARKRVIMQILASVANLLWVLYFAFYGDMASALTCFIASVRIVIFMQSDKHKWANAKAWLIVFLILQTVVAIFTYSSWISLIPITAGYFGIFAYYVKSAKTYRALSFFYIICWVLNSALNFYIVSLISDSMSCISICVAIYRFGMEERRLKQKKQILN